MLYHNRFQLTHLINESIFSEFLAEGLYFSVDPYMRIFDKSVGEKMIGEVIGEVIASKSKLYNVGDRVLAKAGWCTHAIVDELSADVRPDPLIGTDLSPSLALGTVGMPGATAYFG